MPVKRNKVEDPCQSCRDRHAKCDPGLPRCKQCERLDEECVRVSSSLKFKVGSSAKYDKNFKKDQPWLTQSKHVKVQFIDQTPELENYYALEPEIEDEMPSASRPAANPGEGPSTGEKRKAPPDDFAANYTFSLHTLPNPRPSSAPTSTLNTPPFLGVITNQKRPVSRESSMRPYQSSPNVPDSPFDLLPFHSPAIPTNTSIAAVLNSTDGFSQNDSSSSMAMAVEAEYRRLADSSAAAIPSPESGLLSPAVWKRKFFWPNSFTTTQCACLMRYYVDELAPWLDVCDPARQFATVVPQSARRCPPLLNAIFTAAARHLSRISKYKTSDGVVRYQGVTLRDLTSETAISYHNVCLAYLIELSADSRHVTDENLLAAAVILRYYEELDFSLTGEDPEHFLHTFQIFTDAHFSANTPPLYDHTFLDISVASVSLPYTVNTHSFRHASFRIALRQEITSAFSKQRPIRLPFPLRSWSWKSFTTDYFANSGETEDAIWTDRLMAFCADVVQFCFGGDNTSSGSSIGRLDQWKELKEFDSMWEKYRPFSYGAIHYQEPDPGAGEAFPQIWYLSSMHVAGVQYLDLARILLAVYDPTVPRLGAGAAAATKKIGEEVRKLVLKLCGVATSNANQLPALVIANMAISVCGEYFTDKRERKAMLDLLEGLERDYAWPTSKSVREAKEIWKDVGE